jgi:lipid-binding SYLF domain-containing protein
MKRIFLLAAPAAIAALMSANATAASVSTPELNSRVDATMERFYEQGTNHRELARKAAAVLVFPRITKAGAGVGGEYGVGALEVNGVKVGYYKVTGASVGATVGAARRSEVLLFMTEAAKDQFLKSDGWTIGADAGVAVVKGAGAELDSETLRRPVIAYVFGERGLIADVSLEGAKISKLPR